MHQGYGQGQCDLNRFSYRLWKKKTPRGLAEMGMSIHGGGGVV